MSKKPMLKWWTEQDEHRYQKDLKLLQKHFTSFDNEILFDDDLGKDEKLVLLVLYMRSFGNKMVCMPGRKSIGRMLGIHPDVVSTITTGLQKKGWIEKKRRGRKGKIGRTNEYKLLKKTNFDLVNTQDQNTEKNFDLVNTQDQIGFDLVNTQDKEIKELVNNQKKKIPSSSSSSISEFLEIINQRSPWKIALNMKTQPLLEELKDKKDIEEYIDFIVEKEKGNSSGHFITALESDMYYDDWKKQRRLTEETADLSNATIADSKKNETENNEEEEVVSKKEAAQIVRQLRKELTQRKKRTLTDESTKETG